MMASGMTAESRNSKLHVVQIGPLTRPAWVRPLFENGTVADESIARDGMTVQVSEAAEHSYVQVVLHDALTMDSQEFEGRVTAAYAVLGERLKQCRARHPLRFWNFVPGIHQPGHDGMNRYEVFNSGRFAAFTDWYRSRRFATQMIAASGVGHRGSDFVLQVLAARYPGRGVENPRQRAAYRYSRRYGPLPPCFARGTVVDHGIDGRRPPSLIVAGTASVVGEDSQHPGDLENQLRETCANLTSLVEAASANGNGRRPDPLARFQEMRAYVVDEASRRRIVDTLTTRFVNLRHLELMPADLCRGDLLVEVEGIVKLNAASHDWPT